MLRDIPLHNFLFETDPDGFYEGIHGAMTPWIDACVLLHLIRRYRPEKFLEVGTHRGQTSRLLAERFPEMFIVTVDPGDQIPPELRPHDQQEEYLSQEKIGELVTESPNVEVIKKPFRLAGLKQRKFDMIFMDGDRSTAALLEESYLAVRLLEHPGVLVWHHYNHAPNVNHVLNMIELPGSIVHIHNTWIAYYDTH